MINGRLHVYSNHGHFSYTTHKILHYFVQITMVEYVYIIIATTDMVRNLISGQLIYLMFFLAPVFIIWMLTCQERTKKTNTQKQTKNAPKLS